MTSLCYTGIWHHITGWLVPSISSQCSSFILKKLSITWPCRIKPPCCVDMSGTSHPLTRHHIAEDWNPPMHHCKSLKTCNIWPYKVTWNCTQSAFHSAPHWIHSKTLSSNTNSIILSLIISLHNNTNTQDFHSQFICPYFRLGDHEPPGSGNSER
jgi:hypothetical protein